MHFESLIISERRTKSHSWDHRREGGEVSLVIFILRVGNGPLLGLALHLVSSPAGQTVHHLHGVVGRTLQHEPEKITI